MRLNQQVLKKVKVEEKHRSGIDLINVQTGEVEERIETGKRYLINYQGHEIRLDINANYEKKTTTYTDISINFNKLSIYALAALFTVYKEVLEAHQNDYDGVDLTNLYRQRDERSAVRQEIIKEEKKYEKKLMMDEIKRLAKENVDSRRPPVTASLPKTKLIEIETTEEVNDAIK